MLSLGKNVGGEMETWGGWKDGADERELWMLNVEMSQVDRGSAKSRMSHVTNMAPHRVRPLLRWKKAFL